MPGFFHTIPSPTGAHHSVASRGEAYQSKPKRALARGMNVHHRRTIVKGTADVFVVYVQPACVQRAGPLPKPADAIMSCEWPAYSFQPRPDR
jgi:hypothetical protein